MKLDVQGTITSAKFVEILLQNLNKKNMIKRLILKYNVSFARLNLIRKILKIMNKVVL